MLKLDNVKIRHRFLMVIAINPWIEVPREAEHCLSLAVFQPCLAAFLETMFY